MKKGFFSHCVQVFDRPEDKIMGSRTRKKWLFLVDTCHSGPRWDIEKNK